jgi:hypothetical protein
MAALSQAVGQARWKSAVSSLKAAAA